MKRFKTLQPYWKKIRFQKNIGNVLLETGVAKKLIKVCEYIPKNSACVIF